MVTTFRIGLEMGTKAGRPAGAPASVTASLHLLVDPDGTPLDDPDGVALAEAA